MNSEPQKPNPHRTDAGNGAPFYPDGQDIHRNYSPEEAGHDSKRKPVSRFRHRKPTPPNPGVIIVAIIFSIICAVCLYLVISGKNKPADADTLPSADNSGTVAVSDTAETTENSLDYFTVNLPGDDIYTGNLILVNYAHEYKFPQSMEDEIITVRTASNGNYKLRELSTRLLRGTVEHFNVLTQDYYAATGFNSLQINSAYRTYTEQQQIYADYTEQYGAEYAKKYVANPGYSEHHTGLALDLNVYIDGQGTYYVESYDGCQWFRDNAEQYGFVLRYPKEKVYITGIDYESWHYRFVGLPHSVIMLDLDLCLEEYIDYLRSFTYETNRLYYNDTNGSSVLAAEKASEMNGGTQIYYVPAGQDSTEIKIPKDSEYSISGNNIDGYIVTATAR